MEILEKKVLKKYKLWQEIFELNPNAESKDTDEYCLFDKDFDLSYSVGCKGCGCYGCKD